MKEYRGINMYSWGFPNFGWHLCLGKYPIRFKRRDLFVSFECRLIGAIKVARIAPDALGQKLYSMLQYHGKEINEGREA